MGSIYRSLIITPESENKLRILNPGYLVVSSNGVIEAVSGQSSIRKKYRHYKFFDYSESLICPGFIDTHNHLPQHAFAGIGDRDLLPWLKKYTFPRERTFSDSTIAKESAEAFFSDLVRNGTTTTLTYVTIHRNATDIAFRCAERSGIRAILGKVMMDQNSPSFLTEQTDASFAAAEELIEKWHGKNGKLFYCLTPRFAITCSFELMERAGRLARERNVYIQTHLSENAGEIEFVKKLFPRFKNYTDVYYKAGLLGPKTIMAHGIYLSDAELRILKKMRTAIAHCPTSNRFLNSGIMPFRKYRTAGLKMGLGTDVAGGYSLSMFSEMREAIENSKQLALFSKGEKPKPMSLEEAFYLATLGGARVLSLENQTGSLELGKKADFLVIDYRAIDPMKGKGPYLEPMQILSKLIYRGNELVVRQVFVDGVQILK